MTNEATKPRSSAMAKSLPKWLMILAGVALLTNLTIVVWFCYETRKRQQLVSENNVVQDGSDSLSTRLQELEKKLAVRRADYRRTMSQFMSIVSQMHGQDAYPISDGPGIVSSARQLNPSPASPQKSYRGDHPVRLTCYIPPGNHQLIHGFQIDSNRSPLELPDRVVQPTEPGKIHEVTISVGRSDGAAVLVINTTPPSSNTTVHEYRLGDDTVEMSFRGARSWYRIPNENPGTPDLLENEIPWNRKSDLPNQILWLHVTNGKDSFDLRFGVESDAPASASALILASRSRDFLQRISGEYKPPSDAEVALRWLFPGPSLSVPEHTPRLEEIFDPPDTSGRLIYRKGWATKTLEPY